MSVRSVMLVVHPHRDVALEMAQGCAKGLQERGIAVYAFEESSPTASFVSRTGVEARAFAVERLLCLIDNYRDPWGADRIRKELAGSDLACWCPLGQPCHADVLLEIANRGEGA